MRLKDLDVTEYPRERMIRYGVENLSDNDLLSIILRSGSKDYSVKELASSVLKDIKSIENVVELSYEELIKYKGIGKTKAITLLSVVELAKRINSRTINNKMSLNNSNKIFNVFKQLFIDKKQEYFIIILLDIKKRLIKYKTLFIGTIDSSIVHIREIIKESCKSSASSIVCMHNHPSGDVKPSKEDILFTIKLKNIMKDIGIPLIDHIITDGLKYYSFYEENSDFNNNCDRI